MFFKSHGFFISIIMLFSLKETNRFKNMIKQCIEYTYRWKVIRCLLFPLNNRFILYMFKAYRPLLKYIHANLWTITVFFNTVASPNNSINTLISWRRAVLESALSIVILFHPGTNEIINLHIGRFLDIHKTFSLGWKIYQWHE